MESKKCRCCGEEKPIREFWLTHNRPKQWTAKCRECRVKTASNRGVLHIRPDHLDESFIYCYKGKHWVQKDTEIYKSSAQKRGYAGTCIECDRVPMSSRSREHDRRLRAWVQSQKEGIPCSECGIVFDTVVADWHHRDPSQKLFSISCFHRITKDKTKILEEIAKCDLVCSNCHRIKTAAEGWRNQYS